jgi:hypothetical protein
MALLTHSHRRAFRKKCALIMRTHEKGLVAHYTNSVSPMLPKLCAPFAKLPITYIMPQ